MPDYYASRILEQNAILRGHSGLVTKMATSWEAPNLLISASRDKSLIVWEILYDKHGRFVSGRPKKSLLGHGNFVSDVALTSDAKYALSGSWDKTLRLWDLETGVCTRRFISHTKDVTSVCFSEDNRRILSASRDKTIKLWNTLGQCKVTFNGDQGHNDWVSSVDFSSIKDGQAFISVGWDRMLKVWDSNSHELLLARKCNDGPVVAINSTLDKLFFATGGKDGMTKLWAVEYINCENYVPFTLPNNEAVVALAFAPATYWLAVAYETCVKIWGIEEKAVLQELSIDREESRSLVKCSSLEWSVDGMNLFVGFDDNTIRVWTVTDDFRKSLGD